MASHLLINVNIPVKWGIDEFREMIRVLREEIERGILFCVEEPVFYLVFFSHELFVVACATGRKPSMHHFVKDIEKITIAEKGIRFSGVGASPGMNMFC